jgi:hypothetical protein
MEEESEVTLGLLKEQKQKIINQIKNTTDIDIKTKLLNLLIKIDDNIKNIISNIDMEKED